MKHSTNETVVTGKAVGSFGHLGAGATSEAPSVDDLDDVIARFEIAVMRIGREIGRRAYSGEYSDLTGPQHHILRLLCRSGGGKVGDMADMLQIQPSAVTAMTDRLEARGYVVRERDEDDRRVVWIRPTESGAEAYRKVEEDVRAYVRGLLSVLEPEELHTMVAAYEKMSEAASAAEGDHT